MLAQSLRLVMGPSPGPAWAWPEPTIFLGIGLKILRRAQARAGLFEKGLENLSFFAVKS